MNTTQLWINLVFYCLFVISLALTVFQTGYGPYTLATEVAYYTLFFIVMAAIIYILVTFELTDFSLCTVCNEDSTVSIIGVDLNGKELFKFIIDEKVLSNQYKLPSLEVFLKKNQGQ